MRIPYNWLKDYVDVKIDPKKLAHVLTMSGTNAASCEKIGGDYIFEFEITANRPDCLAVLGIARETAALSGKKLKVPKDLQAKLKSKRKQKPSLSVAIKDPELCFRYTARIIRDVEVGPSADWLKKRIISVGLRPVNNIVDITNFVLFETGQPMHAFDLDKIRGGVCVRRAKRGEKIITIDNVPRTCTEDMLVIADETGPIAIAGVMGGLETEVNRMTKNILLESAFFNPVSVRRTSRGLGIASESSYRFERRIDNDMVVKASNRASALIEALAGGEIGELLDAGKKTCYSKSINFDLKKANSILGVSIGKTQAAKILKALGFSVKDKKRSVKVTVPSFREDVKSDIDLTEEIARIYGYEKIPLTIPHIIGNTRIKDFATLFEEKIERMLTRLGLNEIITYSLINRSSIKELGIRENEVIAIKNPLSIDQEIMRPTMVPGMLGAISYNINRKAKRLSLFEIGKLYKEKEGSYAEEPVLSVGLAGIKHEDWKVRKEEFDFFDIKGVFEKLLAELGFSRISFKKGKAAPFNGDVNSIIEFDGEAIACLGEVDRKICDRFDIEKKVLYGELYINKLLKKARLGGRYTAFGRYPSITRDISIIVDKGIASSEVTGIIKEVGKRLVKDITLVDYYKGKQIPEGKRGLLFRIEYRSDERTLKDAEVDKLHSEIKSTLSSKLPLSFR